MNLPTLCECFEAFVDGRIDRAELREWVNSVIVASQGGPEEDEEAPRPWSPAGDQEVVFWQLLWLADDDDNDDQRLRDLASRSLRCIDQCGGDDATSELIPLITSRDRLCPIVTKHRAGIVSQLGLHSVIRKTFWHEHYVREWALSASLETLEELCLSLAEDDYRRAAQLLGLPPA